MLTKQKKEWKEEREVLGYLYGMKSNGRREEMV
jgi:hypothetical protein